MVEPLHYRDRWAAAPGSFPNTGGRHQPVHTRSTMFNATAPVLPVLVENRFSVDQNGFAFPSDIVWCTTYLPDVYYDGGYEDVDEFGDPIWIPGTNDHLITTDRPWVPLPTTLPDGLTLRNRRDLHVGPFAGRARGPIGSYGFEPYRAQYVQSGGEDVYPGNLTVRSATGLHEVLWIPEQVNDAPFTSSSSFSAFQYLLTSNPAQKVHDIGTRLGWYSGGRVRLETINAGSAYTNVGFSVRVEVGWSEGIGASWPPDTSILDTTISGPAGWTDLGAYFGGYRKRYDVTLPEALGTAGVPCTFLLRHTWTPTDPAVPGGTGFLPYPTGSNIGLYAAIQAPRRCVPFPFTVAHGNLVAPGGVLPGSIPGF